LFDNPVWKPVELPSFEFSQPDSPPASRSLFDRPLESPPDPLQPIEMEHFVITPVDPPLGFTGPSGVKPTSESNAHFVPVEDRWRIGFPSWDRYGQGDVIGEDVPYEEGRWWDPFNQNVLKGDYPIIGQHTFLNLTAFNRMLIEGRFLPTPQNGFDSTARQGGANQFGRPSQFLFLNYTGLSIDLFHGDAAFKPIDWRIKVTPIFNVNHLDLEEIGVVNPDVRKGSQRSRTWFALEEWFIECKLADLGPDYDFVSMRLGSQPFNVDFRGFLFSDINRAFRIFGTLESNRDQFNLAVFKQFDKDVNSQLNTFEDRAQTIVIGNFFRQDCLWPGYTAQVSATYNSDRPSFKFDKNGFLVRPDPVGVAQTHGLDVVYLGWAGDGHIERWNITHQFYWALGRDSFNPIANQGVDINAQMFALELSYDRDWARFRASFFWSSGDNDPNNSHGCGFDTILDNPNFAGGEFSFWQRQGIPLLGVNLKQRMSLVPDLRSSKIQGQANFVNPGLFLGNIGLDLDLTPKCRVINNANLLWFDETQVLETFVFQKKVHHFIGTDISCGVEYRPLLSNNIIITAGASMLVPGIGLRDLYNNVDGKLQTLAAGFMELNLQY
jgi:hypothetical protein